MAYIKIHFAYFLVGFLRTISSDDEIGTDYYFGGEVLRSHLPEDSCHDINFKVSCYRTCGGSHLCQRNQCYCLSFYGDYGGLSYVPVSQLPEDYQPRPVLRHHIAHFCPDLDKARTCIRICMKLGKPAFCGKDHICYCGHKTDDPKFSMKVNVDEVYADFQDMYEKYFGNKEKEHRRTDESEYTD